ncbi:lambda-crystallin homolog [Acanthaster planci]|uniref:Lambda-crystallin homolog n=1 Tax=Acanthaster planci TaxID=133434 RepID=A0A8B7YU26_ACAPL|nr:lambda-crystallin homolog [Acanthaster planci]XP_022094847.1 lambda-crystallin homolog [Acanthaster planci]
MASSVATPESLPSRGKIGIIGSGLIGRSWTLIFISAGYNVTIFDIEQSQLSSALVDIDKQLVELQKSGLLRGTLTPEQQKALVSVTSDMKEAVTGSLHIQECVPENEALKKKVFAEIEQFANDATVLCSSTSCIVPSKFTEHLKRRSQCIVAHPVNPPYYCPLVEIVPSPWTEQSVISRTRTLLEEVGQVPVTVKREVDGFALNRLQYAIINEAWRLVADGVMSPEDVDKVFTAGLGMRYAFCGPFEVIHLNAEGTASYLERYGSTIERVTSTFGPSPTFTGQAYNAVVSDSNAHYPLDKLQEIRQWRDARLVALAKLKKDLEPQKPLQYLHCASGK